MKKQIMETQTIKIQYLYHSGFRVETKKHLFIFDYLQGKLSMGNKNILVFCSHAHPDHFNPRIFEWQRNNPSSKYILSDDIRISDDLKVKEKKENIYFMSPSDEIQIEDVNIKAYGSTDVGVSFLIEWSGIHLFHAGDLNWWHWWRDTPEGIEKAEQWFKEELAKIKPEPIDIAFFPVDPRLEHNYCLGADYFLQELTPKILIPMHFGDDFEVSKKYTEKMKDHPTKVIGFTKEEQEIILDIPITLS
jgi:L-ascorbate metabolism protein UlaG (beta-lactamase superfamily)